MAVQAKRTVDGGQRDRSANCIWKRSPGEGNRACICQIGRDATHRDRQRIEVSSIVIAKELAVEELIETLIGKNRVAKADPMLQADLHAIGQIARVLATPEVSCLVGGVEGEHRAENIIIHDVLQLIDALSGRVERPHHAAHTGAGNHVDRDVMLLKPLQHADLAHRHRAATTQRQTNTRSTNGPLRRRSRGHGRKASNGPRCGLLARGGRVARARQRSRLPVLVERPRYPCPNLGLRVGHRL